MAEKDFFKNLHRVTQRFTESHKEKGLRIETHGMDKN
jgi:hypothetical protein